MISKRTNIMMIVCLLIGLLPGLFLGFKGSMAIKTMVENNKKASEGQSAIRILRITVSKKQRNMLIEQLEKFADKSAFAIRITRHDPNGYNFSVDLWRDDIWISGLYPTDPETLSLGFYYTVQARPVSERIFDDALSDLEGYINEIPNATISVEK